MLLTLANAVVGPFSHGKVQGSEKWGRWGSLFPDRAKSHGQFGPKTTYKTDGQTERQTDRQSDTDSQIKTVKQSED